MKCKFYIIFCLLLSHLWAQENYRVRKIRFDGNTIASPQLLARMTLQPKNGLKRLRDKSPGVAFSHELLQNDIDELVYFYQKEGFLQAAVELQELRTNDKKETVEITLKIDEGRPVKVNRIIFEVQGDSAQQELNQATDKARSQFRLQEGTRFRDADLKSDMALLKNMLVNFGFAFSKIDYILQVDRATYQTDIIYTIDSGPLCYFGNVVISGNDHVADKIIHRQISFEKGEVFSRQSIDKSQEQIYALNVFQIVSLQAAAKLEKDATIPISIKIKEAPRFTNKFGVGWGQEDKFRASMDTQWLRFLGGARRLNLFLKHSALEPYHINLRFSQPGFLNPNTSLGVNPFIRRQNEPGYNVDRRGASIYVQRQISRVLNTGVTYTFEKVHLDTTTIGAPDLQSDLTDFYNKSSVTVGMSQNNTDDIFSPTRGFNNGMTFKFSGIGPSTYDYTKWMIDLRQYIKFPRGVLATRIKLGDISSMDVSGFIPVEDRFYSGGSNSVRGWARHELGPKDSNGKPVGGHSLLEASLEARIPIFGSFDNAVFWDFGNVWEKDFGDILNDINHALGIGLRFRTPIGPVRFDVAVPVFNEAHHIRWHLTIGEAF